LRRHPSPAAGPGPTGPRHGPHDRRDGARPRVDARDPQYAGLRQHPRPEYGGLAGTVAMTDVLLNRCLDRYWLDRVRRQTGGSMTWYSNAKLLGELQRGDNLWVVTSGA